MDLTFKYYDPTTPFDPSMSKGKVAEFLYQHLDEYGDKKEDILRCLDFALKEKGGLGGFILVGLSPDEEIAGAVIINKTGMKGYIPENILVYIAVHGNHRGKGVGKKLMQEAINRSEGNIALHVEPDNPAKFLYEKLGFTNKYLEMRFNR